MNPPAFFTPKTLFDRIHAALPQTQCTRCGFPDCAAYAQAISSGLAAINQCPPGGAEGVALLSQITGLPALPLNPSNGVEGPRTMAVIDEAWCIGCTLCIKACPVDAIMGSNKLMHTVMETYCTGCELCVPVCPVDCISLENVTGQQTGWSAWSSAEAKTALLRYEFHSYRSTQDKHVNPETLENVEKLPLAEHPEAVKSAAVAESASTPAERKRAVIEAALARARAQRGAQA
ncbi:electron transport complex protein RnfB [Polaromonas sp. CG_9.5]|uniref:electron transport complex subunit RsxB n=1 Tax=Polaromonas sp. CG_9.5 TaxID=3071705 RepID=UPI002E0476D4|nr:electron transport complex protein RnfB [Polaromonas sp. CG_9.5]